jgi:molecular chaperone GrpE
VPDASVPTGTVVQVVQPGYTISGRVLRPAMVGVAKAPAGTPAPDGDGGARRRDATAERDDNPDEWVDTSA